MTLLQIAEPNVLAIGIDFGTTNSLVGTIMNDQVIFAQDDKCHIMPSTISYKSNLVAKHSIDAIYSIKRFVGKSLSDIKLEYPDIDKIYDLVDDGQLIKFSINNELKSVQTIMSDIFRHLKSVAQKTFKGIPTHVVITVPAYFDEVKRSYIKQAAIDAKLNVIRLLNEPTAAALAYGLETNGIVVVYDLGGGTFDLSILEINDNVFEVLGVNGDAKLGGDDIDYILAMHIIHRLKLQNLSQEYMRTLLSTARHIKERLSFIEVCTTQITLDNIYEISITREELTELIEHLIQKTLNIISATLLDLNLTVSDINHVVLVGGSTRIICLQNAIKNFFQQQPLDYIDPDTVVAMGASIFANKLANQDKNYLLLDVTPLSLGIEIIGNMVECIIPRNSTLPITAYKDFTTYIDNQKTISIHVLQGEGELVNECKSLAKFILHDLPHAKAGSIRIRVTFKLDSDGILHVHATELTNNTQAHISTAPILKIDEINKYL